jgi:hypothetical protein
MSNIDLESDAQLLAPSDNAITRISDLAHELVERQATVDRITEELKNAVESLRIISEDSLPAAMLEAGVKDFTLRNGHRVLVEEGFAVSIPAAKKDSAFAWLRSHNAESLIKTEMKMVFGKGEDSRVAAVTELLKQAPIYVALLDAAGADVTAIREAAVDVVATVSSVHPSTLKAYVKEQRAAGVEFPEEGFSIYDYTKAIVK